MKWRLKLIKIGLFLFAFIIIVRLIYWQIIKTDSLSFSASRQRVVRREELADRGSISTFDGNKLVVNQNIYTLIINPEVTQWKKLSHLFPTITTLAPKGKWFIVAKNVDEKVKEQVDNLNLLEVMWEPGFLRSYPDASVSAHLLGFVGQDENGKARGYFGLEGYYDRDLAGKPGQINQETDALNRPILLSGSWRINSQPGLDLVTSINSALQYISYQKLAEGLTKYQAKAGTVTIMEPKTGRILAMVSLPNYDPKNYNQSDQNLFKNPIIADAYEPGSTFKTIIMASAIDAGVINPNTKCDICDRPVKITDYTIRTWNNEYHPASSMTDVLVNSDNVGMVFVSRKLGTKNLHTYLKKFGFGEPTGIDLQEEIAAPLRPEKDWYEIDYATGAFGQGIAVTPIQVLRAVSAIANGGIMTNPKVVDKIGTKIIKSGSFRRVISESASKKMTEMMVKSVEAGEAKWAKPKGLVIAGKTGTAQIPVSGHYDKDKTIASFVGFAPADNPRFAMLVTLLEPKTSPWGSETAAPLWFGIAREFFRLGI